MLLPELSAQSESLSVYFMGTINVMAHGIACPNP
jgi:hypothetical protein